MNAKLVVLSDLVSSYGENFFSAGVFFIGIDILRDVKMWERRICECQEHITLL